MAAPQIGRDRVATLRPAGFDSTPSGNGIYIECLVADGRNAGGATILNPEITIREHFFDSRIRRAKELSVFGVVLSALMYIAEVVERRKREQREKIDSARVNDELTAARAELLDLKAQQDPSRMFDAIKREAEWAERRGGPKNPFRR